MKITLDSRNVLYPMLTTLVGATVNGRPNFLAIAHVGIMDFHTVSVSINRTHHTTPGIKENKTFSVNIPSADMVRETDYCGLVSGREVNKAELFTVFYGSLKTAPMIEECPINMECRLARTVEFPKHDVFMGEIVATYCSEECLTEGALNISKLQPLLFTMSDKGYWKLGERLATAWSAGKKLIRK